MKKAGTGSRLNQMSRRYVLFCNLYREKVVKVFIFGGISFKQPLHPELWSVDMLGACWGPGAHSCPVCVQNMTNTVVRTTLRNDLSPEGIIHHLKILSPIHCAFQNDLLTSSGYTPEWG